MPNTLQSPAQQVQNGVSDDLLITAHAAMLAGRHFNQQASNLAKQGYMGAYPSSLGQEACQVAAALALEPADWLFPTYRDSVAVMSRGIDLAEVLYRPGGNPARHAYRPRGRSGDGGKVRR